MYKRQEDVPIELPMKLPRLAPEDCETQMCIRDSCRGAAAGQYGHAGIAEEQDTQKGKQNGKEYFFRLRLSLLGTCLLYTSL